ncbi:MAG TPA: MarR family winged helix-turn-helix transcriptional regulator [Caulobacteraceae bacterium]|nr:MarR family winged helix-turn-helix transcriptional regulator [Caulobacteraceae bacterium]
MGKKHKGADAGLCGSATHLLHRVLQLALDYHAAAAGPEGLTQRQYTVLAAAGASDGVSQSDLVRATGIDRSTLADLVARMSSRGLIERQRSALDARINTVRLSEAGRAALALGGKPAAKSDARLLALLSPKKRASFLKSLATLAAAADAARAPAKASKKARKLKKTNV